MKNVIKLIVTGIQLFADGAAVLITKPSKENPSVNGVHKLNAGQFRRIVLRCLGVENPILFKHLIEMSNGTAQLTIDAELIQAGDTYKKADGSIGTYEGAKNPDGTKKGDGSWTKYSNHEVKLGAGAQMKLVELSAGDSFRSISYAPVAKPVVAEARAEDTGV